MKLGLLAGGGKLPLHVARAAAEGGTPLFVIGLEPFVETTDFPQVASMQLGQFGKIVKTLQRENCTHLCFAGVIKRPDFRRLKPDLKAMLHLPGAIKAAGQGDDALMRHVLGLFESEGFKIVSPQEICASLLIEAGALGSAGLSVAHRDDALRACEIAREIGRLDIGQGAVVAGGLTLAVEAQEGTDAMLARIAQLPAEIRGTPTARKGVLAKLIKPGQDTRVDLPTIGPETVRLAAESGLAGIVTEAGRAFVIDREQTAALADAAGIFVAAIPAEL